MHKAEAQADTKIILASIQNILPSALNVDACEHPWIKRFVLSLDDESDESIFDRRVLAVLSTVPRHVSKDFENECTDVFLTIYSGVNVSKRAVGGFMHYLFPMLKRIPLDSPLHKAVSAVAVNMAVLWSVRRNESTVHRSYYVDAVNSLRKTLSCPDRSRDDDVLMAALLMDFCDALSAHFRGEVECMKRRHQMGALALVKHRGSGNFKNEVSKAMMIALQNGVIHNALQSQSSMPPNSQCWFEHAQMPRGLISQLDALALPLTHALSRAKDALETFAAINNKILPDLQTELINLDRQYVAWQGGLPKDCEPHLVWGEKIPFSIRKAGVYRDQCSVYQDLQIANMLNVWRMRRVMLLRTLKECTIIMHSDEAVSEKFITAELDQATQVLVDGICDSIPFFLGDYIDKVPPLQHSPLTFPYYEDEHGTIPEDPKAHGWHAACAGGWLIMTPLIHLCCLSSPVDQARPIVLRPGQRDWIRSQLERLEVAWKLPSRSWPTNIDGLQAEKGCLWMSMAHRI